VEKEELEMTIARMFVDLIDTFGTALEQDAVRSLLCSCRDLMRGEEAYLFEADHTGELCCSWATNSAGFQLQTEPTVLRKAHETRFTCRPTVVGWNQSTLVSIPMCIDGQDCRVVTVLVPSSEPSSVATRIPVCEAYLLAASRLIDQCNRAEQNRQLALQLQGALDSRVVIEQAKGILAERNHLDLGSAFQELRRQSRNGGVPIAEVARSVVQLGGAA
jgi:ANTAR domain